MHFTHVEHLSTVVEHGLMSDAGVHDAAMLSVEVGNLGIKDQRRHRAVPVQPPGAVSDFVPFYFGPRSPMMYAIAQGNVPSYQGGTSRLIYLVTTLDRLHELGYGPILTDRNAALEYAAYREFDPSDPIDDGFIDWELMEARYWNDFDDGRERRMAECLVRDMVPWEAFIGVVAQNDVVAQEAKLIAAGLGVEIDVRVRPQWYF